MVDNKQLEFSLRTISSSLPERQLMYLAEMCLTRHLLDITSVPFCVVEVKYDHCKRWGYIISSWMLNSWIFNIQKVARNNNHSQLRLFKDSEISLQVTPTWRKKLGKFQGQSHFSRKMGTKKKCWGVFRTLSKISKNLVNYFHTELHLIYLTQRWFWWIHFDLILQFY